MTPLSITKQCLRQEKTDFPKLIRVVEFKKWDKSAKTMKVSDRKFSKYAIKEMFMGKHEENAR